MSNWELAYDIMLELDNQGYLVDDEDTRREVATIIEIELDRWNVKDKE